jgi:hypothetical protein
MFRVVECADIIIPQNVGKSIGLPESLIREAEG